MEKNELQSNLNYLVNKYISDKDIRENLNAQILNNKAKFVLAEIDQNKIYEYSESDISLIKDIAFYYC